MRLVSNSMTSHWKESYGRKILIDRNHTKEIHIRMFGLGLEKANKTKKR